MSALDVLVAGIVRDRWARLPTGPDDEFWWAAPIYWVSASGRLLWCSPRARPGLRAGLKTPRPHRSSWRSARRGPGKRAHLVVNLHVRPDAVRRSALGRPVRDRMAYLARVVLAAHAEPDPERPMGLHGDAGPEVNDVRNLRRGTASDNLRDAWARGERGGG